MKSSMKKKKVMKVKVKKTGKKWQVFAGTRDKTTSGLKKEDMMQNKTGKIVSRKKSLLAKSRFGSSVKPWLECTQKARKDLKIVGMCPIGGKTELGQRFYQRTRFYYDAMKK